MPAIRIEIGHHHIRLIRHPFEPVAEIVHFARFRNFGLTRNRAENETAAVEESDDALLKRDHGRGLLDHRGEDMIEVQRRGDLPRNLQERVERVDLALRLEQIRIVEGNGRLLGDAGEEKKLVLVE